MKMHRLADELQRAPWGHLEQTPVKLEKPSSQEQVPSAFLLALATQGEPTTQAPLLKYEPVLQTQTPKPLS
jgi:hypothetical protein